jgi:hypothetical protein
VLLPPTRFMRRLPCQHPGVCPALDEYAPGCSAALEDCGSRGAAAPRPIRGGDRVHQEVIDRLALRCGGFADLDAAPFVGGCDHGTVARFTWFGS